ncbi:hypothetical protein [Citrobacter portucalensis]|uniref:hypothetical protein n=1 Tax=Citrobacter portucalensis TaxID=1639133 RepID=UPI00201B534F|nr:hypothetical protein [Citrobacter portucalensis]MDW2647667.1 hypothetical protein [Citrobacter portucalensis]
MQTINNRMTENQIADLFSLAVKLQVKAEESDDRDTAILAYSIQSACSNLTESQREFRAADATIHNIELKLTDMAVQLANAESKCRELAAENGSLNDKMNRLATWPGIEFYSSAWEFCNLDGNDALEFMCDVKTPATDAFLAEVRAQGVVMFSEKFGVGTLLSNMVKETAKEFAAQLRKGAAL